MDNAIRILLAAQLALIGGGAFGLLALVAVETASHLRGKHA